MKKRSTIGVKKPSCELVEVPHIAAGKTLSTLSTRNRLLRLKELVKARTRLDWEARMEKIAVKEKANTEIRRKEIKQLEVAMKEIRELREERAATRIAVERVLLDDTQKKSSN